MKNLTFVNPFSRIDNDNIKVSIAELCQEFMNGCNLLSLLLFNFVAREFPYTEQTIYQIGNLNRIVKLAVDADDYEALEKLFLKSSIEDIKELYIKFRFKDYAKKKQMIREISKRLTELGYYVTEDMQFENI